MPIDSASPSCIAIIGGGVVGGGWAARAVLSGCDVRFFDPRPAAFPALELTLVQATHAWQARFPRLPIVQGALHNCTTLAEAVQGADFVQESVSEDPALKGRVLREICLHKGAGVVVGSSTSGIVPSVLRDNMGAGESKHEVVVGHPFVPVYLLPLVEVVGGSAESAAAVERACAVYRALGMEPMPIDTEIDGFIADRLLEAVWREALWLVHDDIATTEQVDRAISGAAGLRWAFMGSFMAYRIAGGAQGMRHFLGQFGPALKWPWTHLMDVPELDATLIDKLVAQSDAQAAAHPYGADTRSLEAWRDRRLCAVMNALDQVARVEQHVPVRAELASYVRQVVLPKEWEDYNAHITEHRYLQLVSETTDLLLEQLGLGPTHAAQTQCGFSTVHSEIEHLLASEAGETLTVIATATGITAKKLRITTCMVDSSNGMRARAKQQLVYVDNSARKSTAIPKTTLANLTNNG